MARLVWVLVLCWPVFGKWWRVESGPFVVFSDAGELPAAITAQRLDLARRAITGLGAGRGPLPLPVTAFVLSERRFDTLRPAANTKGFYQSAPERDFIALRWGSPDFPRVVLHEYVHMLLNHGSGPLPQWLEEGLAEFHSTIEAAGERVRLGLPVPEHVRLLAASPWLQAAELSRINKDSREFNEGTRAGVFYAESWAMVHMLRLSEDYRKGFPSFLAALQKGGGQAAAFSQAFGKSFFEAVTDLKLYMDRQSFPVAQYKTDLEPAPQLSAPRQVPGPRGEMSYAELALATGHAEEARKVYERISEIKPADSETAFALGRLALAQKRNDAAARYFEMAAQYPNAAAAVFFEYAMLLRDTGASRDLVRKNLFEAVNRNPGFAEAQFLLGAAASNENRHAEAIPYLERAAAIFPRQSYFWHALAISYFAGGRKEDAQRAARRALESAATPRQAEMARQAVRLTETPDAPARAIRPEVNVPDSWRNKEGDSRLDGVLERIDCIGKSARFHVRGEGRSTVFLVENPGEVLLKNLSSVTFEFHCGAQKPVPVVVEYKARADSEHGTAGVVTALEFR
ncbi:MAG: tetratricopeptide repeat protein [Bryobacterales bacterium]|nr:tetratricopeptide repeat protein [Bryobacterales bacterium]